MYRKIDMSGRICIPSEMREKINLDVNSEVKIELLDNEIIITNNDIPKNAQIECLIQFDDSKL